MSECIHPFECRRCSDKLSALETDNAEAITRAEEAEADLVAAKEHVKTALNHLCNETDPEYGWNKGVEILQDLLSHPEARAEKAEAALAAMTRRAEAAEHDWQAVEAALAAAQHYGFECSGCGYVHRGDDSPSECPQCGASLHDWYFLAYFHSHTPEAREPDVCPHGIALDLDCDECNRRPAKASGAPCDEHYFLAAVGHYCTLDHGHGGSHGKKPPAKEAK